MNVQQLMNRLAQIKDKEIEVRIPCNGLLASVDEAKLTYMIQGQTDEDHPLKGWVYANMEKLPEAVAFVLEPGDE